MTAAVFQSAVALQQGFGVPGELFTDGPHRAQSFTLVSASSPLNIIGQTCCSITSQGVARAGAGGALGFAGFLVDPKGQALVGDGANPLNPSMVVPNQSQVECLSMGSIVVRLPAAAAIGDLVVYDNTSGAISTIAPNAALPAGKTFAQAMVDYFTPTVAGLAVVTVSPTLVIPV